MSFEGADAKMFYVRFLKFLEKQASYQKNQLLCAYISFEYELQDYEIMHNEVVTTDPELLVEPVCIWWNANVCKVINNFLYRNQGADVCNIAYRWQ